MVPVPAAEAVKSADAAAVATAGAEQHQNAVNGTSLEDP